MSIVPEHRAGRRGVGSQMAVDRSGEHHARNGADRGRLSGTATLAIAARRRRRVPDLLAGLEAKREHAAATFGIGIGHHAVGNRDPADVGQRHVDIGLVGGRAPLHAAIDAALADAFLPEHCAIAGRDRRRGRRPISVRPRGRGGRWRASRESARTQSRSPVPSRRDSSSCRRGCTRCSTRPPPTSGATRAACRT